MADRARVAVFISGSGTNMAALLYASRLPDCPFEVVLVLSNAPDAGGLALARVEGVATFALPHKGMPPLRPLPTLRLMAGGIACIKWWERHPPTLQPTCLPT
jgi:hypothetical protein